MSGGQGELAAELSLCIFLCVVKNGHARSTLSVSFTLRKIEQSKIEMSCVSKPRNYFKWLARHLYWDDG